MKTYSNGVRREEVASPPHDLTLAVVRITRQGNGRWSVVLEVNGTVRVGDGRTIKVNREVRLNERQRGRKPRPAGRRGGK